MDFSQIDIEQFLQASMPVRFQDISPYDFEDFIAELYRIDGFKVSQTDYSGDFGADIIISKDDVTTAVQLKRYAKGSKVGVSDVNQVIAGREYYDTDDAMVITTSSFSDSAVELAHSADVFLLGWPELVN
jgi:restriction system protein